jgi:hypothetical protein
MKDWDIYLSAHKVSGFKVGDIVLVNKPTSKIFLQYGWPEERWITYDTLFRGMDRAINYLARIEENRNIESENKTPGYTIELLKDIGTTDTVCGYSYPFFALKKVNLKDKEINLNNVLDL